MNATFFSIVTSNESELEERNGVYKTRLILEKCKIEIKNIYSLWILSLIEIILYKQKEFHKIILMPNIKIP